MPGSGDANILVGKGSVASSPQHVCSILFPKQLIFKSLPLPSNEPNRNSDLAIALPSCCVITGGVNFVTLTKPYRRAFMRSKPRDCLRLFTDFLRAFTTLSKRHHGQLKFFNIPHSPTIQHTSFSLRNIGLEHRRIKVVSDLRLKLRKESFLSICMKLFTDLGIGGLLNGRGPWL